MAGRGGQVMSNAPLVTPSDPSVPLGPATVGLLVPLTADNGLPWLPGMQIYEVLRALAMQLNACGAPGTPIVLRTLDSGLTPVFVSPKAMQLSEAAVTIGPFVGDQLTLVEQLYSPYGRVIISPVGPHSALLSHNGTQAFNLLPDIAAEAHALVSLVKLSGHTRAALVFSAESYGLSGMRLVSKAAVSQGIDIVCVRPVEESDDARRLAECLSANADVRAVMLWMQPDSAPNFLKTLSLRKYDRILSFFASGGCTLNYEPDLWPYLEWSFGLRPYSGPSSAYTDVLSKLSWDRSDADIQAAGSGTDANYSLLWQQIWLTAFGCVPPALAPSSFPKCASMSSRNLDTTDPRCTCTGEENLAYAYDAGFDYPSTNAANYAADGLRFALQALSTLSGRSAAVSAVRKAMVDVNLPDGATGPVSFTPVNLRDTSIFGVYQWRPDTGIISVGSVATGAGNAATPVLDAALVRLPSVMDLDAWDAIAVIPPNAPIAPAPSFLSSTWSIILSLSTLTTALLIIASIVWLWTYGRSSAAFRRVGRVWTTVFLGSMLSAMVANILWTVQPQTTALCTWKALLAMGGVSGATAAIVAKAAVFVGTITSRRVMAGMAGDVACLRFMAMFLLPSAAMIGAYVFGAGGLPCVQLAEASALDYGFHYVCSPPSSDWASDVLYVYCAVTLASGLAAATGLCLAHVAGVASRYHETRTLVLLALDLFVLGAIFLPLYMELNGKYAVSQTRYRLRTTPMLFGALVSLSLVMYMLVPPIVAERRRDAAASSSDAPSSAPSIGSFDGRRGDSLPDFSETEPETNAPDATDADESTLAESDDDDNASTVGGSDSDAHED